MNRNLVAGDVVYYGESEPTAHIIGVVGANGAITSPIGGYSLASPGENDVVVSADEIGNFLTAYVAAAKASELYQQSDTGLRRLIEAYEATGNFRSGVSDAKVAIFRQVAADYDRIHRVVFYEYLMERTAPKTI